MGKIKQNTNLRHWTSLWFIMAMAVMTAIFLRGGVVVQAEENDSPLSVSSVYMIGDEEYDYEYDLPSLSVGDEVTFKVNAEGGTGNYSYQWYYLKSSDEGDIYEPVAEAQQDTLTVEKKKMTEETYYCEVKDGDNQESAYFYIPTTRTLTTTAYINDEETTNIEARENDEVSMRVVAKSIMDNPDYTYSWYKYDSETNESEPVDCQKDILTITKSNVNEIYYCSISDGVNSDSCWFYIDLKSTVTINKRTYIINGESYDAEEDSLPSLSVGDNITLQVDAETSIEDGDVSYQWYHYVKSDDEEYGNFEKISGETSKALAIKKEKLESEEYCCEVSDKKTSRNADFSIPAVKTLTITKSINGEEFTYGYTTTKGASVTMKVNATSVLGDDKISYQWYDSDYEPIEGETGPTYTVEKGTGYESYYCQVSDTVNLELCDFSLETENTISSVKTYINEREGTSIYNVNPGKKYTLKVEPVSKNKDATYSYSWHTYNEDREQEYVGEDSPELEVTKTKAATDSYYVDITSDDGSRSYISFNLYRKPVISILAYINGEYAAPGDGDYTYCYVDSSKDLELRVDAKSTADGDITYQWSKGAEDDGETETIDGATEAQCTVPAFEKERESYTCTVTCDGYSMDYGFYLINKDSSSARPDPDIRQYILVNGVKTNDSQIYVDKGSKVTLGLNVSDLPEGIKEEDIEYAWYEGDDYEDTTPILSKDKEYTISSISKYTEYSCRLMVNGERLVGWDTGFYIYVNPDITAEITVNGEKIDEHSSYMYVDSFEELYGKDVTIKATDKTNPNAKFTFEWFKTEDEEDEEGQSISRTSVCRLTKEILSDYRVNLYCLITDENGNTQKAYLNLCVDDPTYNGNKYVNGEEVEDNSDEQYKAGEKVTLKMVFPENVSKNLTYQWYDNDWKKINCQKAECTVTKGEDEETYTCIVTDQYNRSMSYDFTLYPVTKLVVKRYVNGKKINKTWYTVTSEETLKLEVKASPDDNVTYQWYQGEYSKKELKGETKSVLSVKVPDKSEELDDYRCVVTRGNERQRVYFNLYRCSHSETEVLPAVPATCEKDGLTEGKRCTGCGEIIVKQEVVKATGHKWDNGTVTTPATTTATGVKTYTCSVCKKTKTEVIPKLPATDNSKPGKSDDTTKKPETTGNTTKKPGTTGNATKKPGTTGNTTKKPATTNTLKTGTKITDKKSKAVYKVTANKTVQYTKASNKAAQKAKKVTVPSTVTVKGVKYQVTTIAANAFKNNKNLKSIVIPASVRTIGKQAFAGCKNLKSITIKTPYLTKKSVGAKAFKGISAKATIKVPKKQLKAYKKLLKAKGVAKSVKIK